jgi:hypothetical protein
MRLRALCVFRAKWVPLREFEVMAALGIDHLEKERRPGGLVNFSGEWPNAAG